MILSQVQEIVTRAIDESPPRLDVIAFHDGLEVPSWMLARMIDAATRGYITPVGEKLLLVPAKTYAQAMKDSVHNIRDEARKKKKRIPKRPRPAPSIKKDQCFALRSYFPPTGPRNPEKAPQRPRGLRALDAKTGYATRVPKGAAKSSLKRSNCVDREDVNGKRRAK